MRTVIVGLVGSLLGACSPTGFLNSIADTSETHIERDIAYADGPRRRLDVYAPRAVQGAPIAIFYYGGGWDSGAKESYAFVAAALAAEGIVTIVPDYRIYPEVRIGRAVGQR
jgi:acetyl esterase/lipase